MPQILHFLPEFFFFLLEHRYSFLLLGFLALPRIRESLASEISGSCLGNELMGYQASIFVLPLFRGSRAADLEAFNGSYLHRSQAECKPFFDDKSPGLFFGSRTRKMSAHKKSRHPGQSMVLQNSCQRQRFHGIGKNRAIYANKFCAISEDVEQKVPICSKTGTLTSQRKGLQLIHKAGAAGRLTGKQRESI